LSRVEKFEGQNPVKNVKLKREPKNRVRFLIPEEEGRLLAAASEPVRTIILTGTILAYGFRPKH